MFIEVSQNVAKFGIHAGLLRNASTIFDTVLNSAEKTEESEELFVAAESTTKTILAGDNPLVFQRLINGCALRVSLGTICKPWALRSLQIA